MEIDKNRSELLKAAKESILLGLRFNPTSVLLKVNLAHFCIKYDKSYAQANALIEELSHLNLGISNCITVNALSDLLRHNLHLQNTYQVDNPRKAPNLNIYKYAQAWKQEQKLRETVQEQLNVQIDFWQNFISADPDMKKLVDICEKVHHKKRETSKLWNSQSRHETDSLRSCTLIYGIYSSVANNDTVYGQKLIKWYHDEIKNLGDSVKVDELSEDTLFSGNIVHISYSILSINSSRILDCSYNIEDVYAWNRQSLMGRPIDVILPKHSSERSSDLELKNDGTENLRVVDETVEAPVMKGDGFISPSWVYVKMNAFMDNGVSYVVILRPKRVTESSTIIQKDGTFNGKASANKLRVLEPTRYKKLKIVSVGPSSVHINKPFNSVAHQIIGNNSNTNQRKSTTVNKNRGIQPDSLSFAQNGTSSQRRLLDTGTADVDDYSQRVKTLHKPQIKQADENIIETSKKNSIRSKSTEEEKLQRLIQEL